jgi:hypothetical protein
LHDHFCCDAVSFIATADARAAKGGCKFFPRENPPPSWLASCAVVMNCACEVGLGDWGVPGGTFMTRFFTIIAALLFLAAAAGHFYRLFVHPFSIVVADHNVPLSASWIGGAVALLLGVMLLLEARR